MRRWVLCALMALMIGLPVSGTLAQTRPSMTAYLQNYLPSAETLGEGWVQLRRYSGSLSTEGANSAAATFAGPKGAHIYIHVYDLPPYDQSADRAKIWGVASDRWQAYADYYAGYLGTDSDLHVARDPNEYPEPDRVDVAFYGDGITRIWAEPAAVALFAIEDGPAVLILVEGEWDGLTTIEACNGLLEVVMDISEGGLSLPRATPAT